MAVGDLRDHTLPTRRSAVRSLHIRRRAKLIEKHPLIHTHVGELFEPRLARRRYVRVILFGGMRGLFFRGNPSRSSVRLTVQRCTGLPDSHFYAEGGDG